MARTSCNSRLLRGVLVIFTLMSVAAQATAVPPARKKIILKEMVQASIAARKAEDLLDESIEHLAKKVAAALARGRYWRADYDRDDEALLRRYLSNLAGKNPFDQDPILAGEMSRARNAWRAARNDLDVKDKENPPRVYLTRVSAIDRKHPRLAIDQAKKTIARLDETPGTIYILTAPDKTALVLALGMDGKPLAGELGYRAVLVY